MIAVVRPVEHVDVGPRQRRHEALHERAVGLVDHPLRLGGDRAEHQRALARAGDAGEHRQPALRDLDADVLEVVLARALHADQVVAVGGDAIASTSVCLTSWRRSSGPILLGSRGQGRVVIGLERGRRARGPAPAPRPTSSWRKNTNTSSPAARNGSSRAAQAASSSVVVVVPAQPQVQERPGPPDGRRLLVLGQLGRAQRRTGAGQRRERLVDVPRRILELQRQRAGRAGHAASRRGQLRIVAPDAVRDAEQDGPEPLPERPVRPGQPRDARRPGRPGASGTIRRAGP